MVRDSLRRRGRSRERVDQTRKSGREINIKICMKRGRVLPSRNSLARSYLGLVFWPQHESNILVLRGTSSPIYPGSTDRLDGSIGFARSKDTMQPFAPAGPFRGVAYKLLPSILRQRLCDVDATSSRCSLSRLCMSGWMSLGQVGVCVS